MKKDKGKYNFGYLEQTTDSRDLFHNYNSGMNRDKGNTILVIWNTLSPRGGLRFGMVGDVPLAARDPYPYSEVIFPKKGTHVYGFSRKKGTHF